MRPIVHVAASAAVSGVLYGVTRSVTITAVSFFCGFLIDIDHVFDYLREYGFRFSLKAFFAAFYGNRFKRLILIFHGWEWMLLLLFLSWRSGWNEVLVGLFFGAVSHLIIDQMGNEVTGPGYFFCYRVAKRFMLKAIVRGTDAE
jgi:hypothetical protein